MRLEVLQHDYKSDRTRRDIEELTGTYCTWYALRNFPRRARECRAQGHRHLPDPITLDPRTPTDAGRRRGSEYNADLVFFNFHQGLSISIVSLVTGLVWRMLCMI